MKNLHTTPKKRSQVMPQGDSSAKGRRMTWLLPKYVRTKDCLNPETYRGRKQVSSWF